MASLVDTLIKADLPVAVPGASLAHFPPQRVKFIGISYSFIHIGLRDLGTHPCCPNPSPSTVLDGAVALCVLLPCAQLTTPVTDCRGLSAAPRPSGGIAARAPRPARHASAGAHLQGPQRPGGSSSGTSSPRIGVHSPGTERESSPSGPRRLPGSSRPLPSRSR